LGPVILEVARMITCRQWMVDDFVLKSEGGEER